jgi:hypothetical protein
MCSFEHSLVQELGYNGYERLRRGFDRAFGGSEFVPKFTLVIDAGCGTGLVGEQVGGTILSQICARFCALPREGACSVNASGFSKTPP